MNLTTERLILRDVMESDGPQLLAHSSAPEFQTYEENPPPTPDTFEDIIRWILYEQDQTPRIHHYKTITLRKNPETVLGSVYLSIHNSESRQAETGYMLGPQYWRKGYITEAARCMVHYGFNRLKLHRIYAADIITENIGSVRVAEKLGFRREAHFRESKFFKGRWWDTYTYAILEHEWRAP